MYTEPFDISVAPVKKFLDAADQVLNSNTFLLCFDIINDDIAASLLHFLHSTHFMEQLAYQDKQRGWVNLWLRNTAGEPYRIRSGEIVKDSFVLMLSPVEANESTAYFIAMLTGDTTRGRFCNYYNKAMPVIKGKAIVDNLIAFLTLGNDWKLFVAAPNFLQSKNDVKGNAIYYFENDWGNNNAAVVVTKNTGYLLLTNGID